MTRLALSLVALLPALTPGGAAAQDDLPSCGRFDGVEMTYACRCGPGMAVGEVYGTRIYGPETDLCAGAVHAGVIQPEGGVVQIIRSVPQDGFTGSERNGIVSRDAPAAPFGIFFMPS